MDEFDQKMEISEQPQEEIVPQEEILDEEAPLDEADEIILNEDDTQE